MLNLPVDKEVGIFTLYLMAKVDNGKIFNGDGWGDLLLFLNE